MEKLMNIKYVNGRYIARDPDEQEPRPSRRYGLYPCPDKKAKELYTSLWKQYSGEKKGDGSLLSDDELATIVRNVAAMMFLDDVDGSEFSQTTVDFFNDDEWCNSRKEAMIRNGLIRVRRLVSKCAFANFNYFVTFTYSDDKGTEEDFRTSLKKCLENMTQRSGWAYADVWQRGDLGDRLHCHVLLRVPGGVLDADDMYARLQWSSKRRKRELITSSKFFDKFGNNDFRAITSGSGEYDHAIRYIARYISRGKESLFYSRHLIDSDARVVNTQTDVLYAKYNFGKCYVLAPAFMYNLERMQQVAEEADLLDLGPVSDPVEWYFVDARQLHSFSEILTELLQVS